MPAGLRIDGVGALAAALRQLPDELKQEAYEIVRDAVAATDAHLRAAYPMGPTGNLVKGLTFEDDRAPTKYGVRMVLINKAKHAWLYDHGSELRHTSEGWSRGRMPAAPRTSSFVVTAMQERARMVKALIGLVERAGFKVRGG